MTWDTTLVITAPRRRLTAEGMFTRKGAHTSHANTHALVDMPAELKVRVHTHAERGATSTATATADPGTPRSPPGTPWRQRLSPLPYDFEDRGKGGGGEVVIVKCAVGTPVGLSPTTTRRSDLSAASSGAAVGTKDKNLKKKTRPVRLPFPAQLPRSSAPARVQGRVRAARRIERGFRSPSWQE